MKAQKRMPNGQDGRRGAKDEEETLLISGSGSIAKVKAADVEFENFEKIAPVLQLS